MQNCRGSSTQGVHDFNWESYIIYDNANKTTYISVSIFDILDLVKTSYRDFLSIFLKISLAKKA